LVQGLFSVVQQHFSVEELFVSVMRIYPLHYISEQEFEDLSILICKKILGAATTPFAKGRDGGKDGRFIGKANCFPSEAQPWNGKIIIQAKHTSKENASCSDSDFQTILQDEIPKIQKLKDSKELDYYLLFTNRKLTGGQDSKIIDLFRKQSIIYEIIANENVQKFLQEYSDIAKNQIIRNLLNPLQFDESDLKKIIITISNSLKGDIKIPATIDFTKIDLKKKNELNNLSKDYFENVMKRDFEYFQQMERFFSLPINSTLNDAYQYTARELNAKITTYRNEYAEFEKIIDEYCDYVINNNITNFGSKEKMLVRVVYHYMYWRCDIGKKEEIC
jgi:hypothetical protein